MIAPLRKARRPFCGACWGRGVRNVAVCSCEGGEGHARRCARKRNPRWAECVCGRLPDSTGSKLLADQTALDVRLQELKNQVG